MSQKHVQQLMLVYGSHRELQSGPNLSKVDDVIASDLKESQHTGFYCSETSIQN